MIYAIKLKTGQGWMSFLKTFFYSLSSSGHVKKGFKKGQKFLLSRDIAKSLSTRSVFTERKERKEKERKQALIFKQYLCLFCHQD